MNNINWDKLPDELTMEQFYKLCHVSKKTARFSYAAARSPANIPASGRILILSERKT